MSAGSVLQAAVAAALKGMDPLAVFDAPPVRAALPYAVVDEPVLASREVWGWEGRDGRVLVTLHDSGERPVRLRAMLGEVEARVRGLAPDGAPGPGEGWRLMWLKLRRSRIVAGKDGRWRGEAEFSARMWRQDS